MKNFEKIILDELLSNDLYIDMYKESERNWKWYHKKITRRSQWLKFRYYKKSLNEQQSLLYRILKISGFAKYDVEIKEKIKRLRLRMEMESISSNSEVMEK
jgi:hypothetical protein